MSKLVHVLAVMVLIALAAGTAVQAATSTDMSLKMSMATMDGDDVADCEGCPGDDAQMEACGQACTIAQAALGSLYGINWPEVAEITTALPPTAPDGYVGPPDPDPPRTIILI